MARQNIYFDRLLLVMSATLTVSCKNEICNAYKMPVKKCQTGSTKVLTVYR